MEWKLSSVEKSIISSKYDLQKKIDKNRDEINYLLNGDYPLDIIYMRIKMLSEQNERLILKLKE